METGSFRRINPSHKRVPRRASDVSSMMAAACSRLLGRAVETQAATCVGYLVRQLDVRDRRRRDRLRPHDVLRCVRRRHLRRPLREDSSSTLDVCIYVCM